MRQEHQESMGPVGQPPTSDDANGEATTPPPLPPRIASAVTDGCECGALNPLSLESAWEQTEIMKANHGNMGSKTAEAEELHLRIYAGTWNVAGKQAGGAHGAAEILMFLGNFSAYGLHFEALMAGDFAQGSQRMHCNDDTGSYEISLPRAPSRPVCGTY